MIANSIIVAGAFVSLVAAVPFAQGPYPKRDVVWETHTEVALTTIPVTVTHWLEPGETPPTDAGVEAAGGKQHYGHKGKGHGHGGHGGHGKPPAGPETTEPVAPQSSSESAAPVPSSYEQPAPAPAPTSTYQAPPPEPTTSQAPPPAYTPEPAPEQPSQPEQPSYGGGNNGLSGMGASGKSYSGDITHWTPSLGACGFTNTTSQPVVAIGTGLFDQYTPTSGLHAGNPNYNTLCKQWVTITGSDGSTTQAQVVDRCGGCADSDLDLSPTLFSDVYPAGDGRVSGVKWSFS